ncbi:hypothetical protein BGZ52_012571, partial [Haplosporangium bisporale]
PSPTTPTWLPATLVSTSSSRTWAVSWPPLSRPPPSVTLPPPATTFSTSLARVWVRSSSPSSSSLLVSLVPSPSPTRPSRTTPLRRVMSLSARSTRFSRMSRL